ncbi:MAG TPA: hypothetical protein VEX68_24480, partial [Bryobacteraceae bacterium]|nr:hypothetical protein [Bryobacteraceae bacterium]
RQVPVNGTNASLNTAGSVSITAIADFKVVSGTGVVSLASPVPIALGDVGPNASAYTPDVVLNWPATATRVQMTFHVSANGGAYTKTTTLTVMR